MAIKNDKGPGEKAGTYFYNRRLVKSRLDKVKGAIDDYVKALENLGDDEYKYHALFNRGIQYRRMGNLGASIEDLQAACGLKKDKPSAYNNLALSQFENEEFDAAINNYDKAITLCKSAVHYNNRGLAHYHMNDLKAAEADFNEAMTIDPHDPTIYFNRGNVYLNQDPASFERAHEDYEHAISIAPNNAKLWHSKGLAYQGEAEL